MRRAWCECVEGLCFIGGYKTEEEGEEEEEVKMKKEEEEDKEKMKEEVASQ